jgi:signal peptidase I
VNAEPDPATFASTGLGDGPRGRFDDEDRDRLPVGRDDEQDFDEDDLDDGEQDFDQDDLDDDEQDFDRDDEAAAAARQHRLSAGARNAIEWAVVIVGAVVITVLLRTFAFQTFYIPSESMVPTLQIGDRLVVNKLADDYHLGDIIVFRRPDTWSAEHDVLIKRVVALEGQTVEVRDNTVVVDGQALDEPYLAAGTTMPDYPEFTVPDNQIFVMGDNREASSDSRENGPVPLDNVVGRAALRIWPVGEFGGL